MKKNLNVDAMILDLRNVQEDFLDRYEQIKLDCMIALTSPRVQTLLSQHNISLDSMLCKNVPEEVSVGVVNGKVTLSSASQTAAGQVLVVNGKLMITPDAAEVLQKYACILVNGMIYCPQCLSAVVSARCILNGKLAVYPDDAVLLPGSSIKLTTPSCCGHKAACTGMNIASWRLTPGSTLPHWPQRAAAFPLQRPSCAQALRPFWPRSSRIPPS